MNKKTELDISLTETELQKVVKAQAQKLKQYIKDSGYNYAQTFFCLHVEEELGQLLKTKFGGQAFACYFNATYNLYHPKRLPLAKGINKLKRKYLDFIIKHGKLPADSTVLKWNNNIKHEAKHLLQNYDTIAPETKFLCIKAEEICPNLYELLQLKFKGESMESAFIKHIRLTAISEARVRLFRLAYLNHIAKTGYLPSIPTVMKIAKDLDVSHPPAEGEHPLCR